MQNIKREVQDDKVVTTTTTVREESRFVDYQDLLDCVRIEGDDHGDAPWDNCDGYEHTRTRVGYHDHGGFGQSANCIARCGRDGTYKIDLSYRVEIELDDLYQYYRLNGASKGVAFDLVAQARRERLNQLVTWYENGWEYWYVCAEYNGYEATGCGGIDDYNYADTYMRAELADELVCALEDDGFVVTGIPEPEPTPVINYRSQMAYRNRLFVVTGR